MIQARKRFSQNFLHDQSIIKQIIDAIDPASRTHVVEIGPGRGALTLTLLQQAHIFSAIEIDRDLIALLKPHFQNKATLIESDVLKIDFTQLTPNPLTVIGNLPYNISTPILFHLLKFKNIIDSMFFMLQKEVVLRMAASPGSKEYGRLSVMVQHVCEVDPLFLVPPTAFEPEPQVESMVVRLNPYKKSPYGAITDFTKFTNIVQHAFSQRRKTLRNALKALDVIIPEGLASKRAGELAVDDFVKLANSN